MFKMEIEFSGSVSHAVLWVSSALLQLFASNNHFLWKLINSQLKAFLLEVFEANFHPNRANCVKGHEKQSRKMWYFSCSILLDVTCSYGEM